MTAALHVAESPSALLLRAADRLDELAGAATPGPWEARHSAANGHRVIGGSHPLAGQATDNRTVHRDGGYPADWPTGVVNSAGDADYIAAVDPPTGSAFAAMLRAAAEDAAACDRQNARHPDNDGKTRVLYAPVTAAAISAARHVLGEAT